MEFRILIFLLIGMLAAACTKEVMVPIPNYEEKIVIEGRVETGMPPFVLISKTKDIYSPTDLNSFLNGFQSGATVTVSDGNQTVVLQEFCSDNLPPGAAPFVAQWLGVKEEDLTNFKFCGYTTFNPSMWGMVGKTYSLTVDFEGKTYRSSTQLVAPVALDSVYWKPEDDLPNHGFSWAKLSDPVASYNAYLWEVKRINKLPDGSERDPSFTRTFSPAFDDEFFNGETFDFAYENPMTIRDPNVPEQFRGFYERGDSVVIKLSSLPPSTYEFLEKKYLQINNGGSPFAVPINVPSNIQGGALGSWSSFSPVYDTLVCGP